LELFPMKYAWQEASGKWNAKWGYEALLGITLNGR